MHNLIAFKAEVDGMTRKGGSYLHYCVLLCEKNRGVVCVSFFLNTPHTAKALHIYCDTLPELELIRYNRGLTFFFVCI